MPETSGVPRNHDPLEGVAPDGSITTGAARSRVPFVFEPVLEAAARDVLYANPSSALYVYGSVATGTARVPASDVDLVAVGLSADDARDISRDLTHRFAGICRSVDIGAGETDDHLGDDSAAYGNRVFLRHYCVHLAGPDHVAGSPAFPADAKAARGFNGDIAEHLARWRSTALGDADPAALARRIGRKTLFAVAGLVSVHFDTWTTDREIAATRWAVVDPEIADGLRSLLAWGDGGRVPDEKAIATMLDGTVARIVDTFADRIGLWGDRDAG